MGVKGKIEARRSKESLTQARRTIGRPTPVISLAHLAEYLSVDILEKTGEKYIFSNNKYPLFKVLKFLYPSVPFYPPL